MIYNRKIHKYYDHQQVNCCYDESFARWGNRMRERLDQDHSVDWLMRCNTVTITGLFLISLPVLGGSTLFSILFLFRLSFLSSIAPFLVVFLCALFSSSPLRDRELIHCLHLVTRNYLRLQLDMQIYDTRHEIN